MPVRSNNQTTTLYPDLIAVVLQALLFLLITLIGFESQILKFALGVPLILFSPGYVIISAFYPNASSKKSQQGAEQSKSNIPEGDGDSITTPVRLGLSVLMSVTFVAAIGVIINASPFQLSSVPFAVGITVLTIAGAVAASRQRSQVSADRRFVLAIPWVKLGRILSPRIGVTYLLGVILVVSSVAAILVVGGNIAEVNTGSDSQFTEFSVLTVNSDGEYVTSNYASHIRKDRPLYFRVSNSEGIEVTYTIVIIRETMEKVDGEIITKNSTEMARSEIQLQAGKQSVYVHNPELRATPRPQRIHALLYYDNAPDTVEPGSASQSLRVWADEDIDVEVNETQQE